MFNMQQSQNPYDFGNQISDFYSGYQQAFIPKQIKQQQQQALQQQQLEAMKQAALQQQMRTQPQLDAEKLKQIQLQNAGLQSSNALDAFKIQQAKASQNREQDFLKLLMGGNGSQANQSPYPQQNLQQQNQQGLTSDAVPQDVSNIYSRLSANQQGIQPNQQQSPLIDQIWSNPQLRAQYSDLYKKYGIEGKQQLFNNPQTGETIVASTMPSGALNFQAIKTGESPYQRSFESTEGANEAGILKTMNENSMVYQQNADDLHMINSVLGDPKLESVMGPVWQSKLTNLAGKPEYQELLGAINVAAGDYYNRMLNMSKGNPSNFDAAQLLKTKIDTDKDSLSVAVGKARALNILNLTSQKREELAQSMIDNGMKPSIAQREANKQIPLDSSRKEVDALVQGKQLMNTPDGKVVAVPFNLVDEALANGGSMYGR